MIEAVLVILKNLPWKWIGLGLAILGISWYAHHTFENYINGIKDTAYKAGIAAQVAVDKPLFDKYNAQVAQQKKDAELLKLATDAHTASIESQNAALRTQLENQSVQQHQAVAALANKYATSLLQFRTDNEARRADPGSGKDSGVNVSQGSGSSEVDVGTIVQLPGPLTTDLRQLLKDADDLKVEYAKCRDWAYRPKAAQFDPTSIDLNHPVESTP